MKNKEENTYKNSETAWYQAVSVVSTFRLFCEYYAENLYKEIKADIK